MVELCFFFTDLENAEMGEEGRMGSWDKVIGVCVGYIIPWGFSGGFGLHHGISLDMLVLFKDANRFRDER